MRINFSQVVEHNDLSARDVVGVHLKQKRGLHTDRSKVKVGRSKVNGPFYLLV